MPGRLIAGLFYLCWVAFVVLTPVLGVWLASSLIAFSGGPTWVALVGGALLFPILPVAWELRAGTAWQRAHERKRQLGVKPKRRLTAGSRVILRTLVLNIAFLVVLAVFFPKVAFPALATRGDWFLDERTEPWAEPVRADLHAAASGLEWLYGISHDNRYKKEGDDAPVPDSVQPLPEATALPGPTARRWIPGTGPWKGGGTPPKPQPEGETPPQPGQPEPEPVPPAPALPDGATYSVGDTHWPWASAPYELKVDETSIESVGRDIAAKYGEPFERVKALHDWVVTRYRYDVEALRTDKFPPQDAKSVFSQRVAVCEGYARTLVALGKVTGDEITYVVGDVREDTGAAMPDGHAWNAVRLKGQWYLMDATWDDPVTKDGSSKYRTDYLFIPPSLMVFDHLPDQDKWQLLRAPLSRGDFIRQPLARPAFAREGLTLVSPERSTVEVEGPLEIELLNPRRVYVMATMGERECGSAANDAKLKFHCDVPRSAVTNVQLFRNSKQYGTYESIATIRATRR